jgi:hypothetical protein
MSQFKKMSIKNKRNNRRRFNPLRRNLRVYVEPTDQQIVFKDVTPFEITNHGEGKSGVYLNNYILIKPYASLNQSSYALLDKVYALVRVKKIKISVWMPGATFNTSGSTVAKLYRDSRPANPNPYYEGLIQERGISRGKVTKRHDFVWLPIEPQDMEFLPVTSVLDNGGRYGQLNFAAINLPTPYAQSIEPIIEFTYFMDFKYLLDPKVPTTIRNANNDDDFDDETFSQQNLELFNRMQIDKRRATTPSQRR